MRSTLPILALAILAILLASLAACSDPRVTGHGPEAPVRAFEDHAEDEADVSPATASAPAAVSAAPAAAPAEDAISYAGYGAVRFGAAPGQVRAARDEEMIGGPAEPGGCYYLYPEPDAGGSYRIAFMIDKDRFVRVDVDDPAIAAPGGGQAGMRIDRIRDLYAGIEEQPHKYIEGGKSLRYRDASGSVVVFETDPAGTVTEWRVGVPPQVDYVEGCS